MQTQADNHAMVDRCLKAERYANRLHTLLWELRDCGYLDDFVLTLTNPHKQATVNRFQTRVSEALREA